MSILPIQTHGIEFQFSQQLTALFDGLQEQTMRYAEEVRAGSSLHAANLASNRAIQRQLLDRYVDYIQGGDDESSRMEDDLSASEELLAELKLAESKANTLAIPAGLSPVGKAAAEVIVKELNKVGGSTGGCRAFYTPKEWAERGEEYGLNAELIVVHDGGDLAPMFNMDYMEYKTYEKAVQALEKVGAWSEGCTCWYTAIYKS